MGDVLMARPMPVPFDPNAIINGLSGKVEANLVQIIIFLAICSVVVGYLFFLIWQEYLKSPVKFHRHRASGKGFKIRDFIRKR